MAAKTRQRKGKASRTASVRTRTAPKRKAPARKRAAARPTTTKVRHAPAKARRPTRVARQAPRPKGRKKSHFQVVRKPAKTRFGNRFQKFYYLHREDLNKFRRAEYQRHKRSRVCVKCSKARVGKSIFCAKHLKLSRVYNRRR